MIQKSLKNVVPPPISGKGGWPWTERVAEFPSTMPNGNPWPRITIVTPSFNQGKFIEETIRSVLCQGYPNLEYIVIDAGSTDETGEILEYYRPVLAGIIIEPDRGQVDAINKGLRIATGDWFNWLNSDDILLPNALKMLATIISLSPESTWVSGTRLILDPESAPVSHEGNWCTDPFVIGLGVPNFPQDPTFIKTQWLRESEGLVEEIRNVFDTLLYYTLCRKVMPLLTTACFSAIRVHSAQKTADSHTRDLEFKKWIKPQILKLPLLSRLALRFVRIRGFSRITIFAVGQFAAKRLTASARQCIAAVYDHRQLEWKLVAASKVVRF